MKALNRIILIALLSSAAVCVAEDSHLKASSTDSSGTTVTTEKTAKDSTGLLGNRKLETEERTVVDPKGLMNKTTTSRQIQEKTSPDSRAQLKRSVDTAGTLREESTEKSVSKHWTDSGDTTTTTSRTTVDPKGLGNKQTAETKETVDRSPDGAKKRTVTKSLNGETVSENTMETR